MKITTHEALYLWRLALSDAIRHAEPDLSARQMAIMLIVYSQEKGLQRVKDLAGELGISKPSTSRALDRLEKLGYVIRKPDEGDGRSVLVQRTMRGSMFLSEFAEFVQKAIDRLLEKGLELT